MCQHLTKFARRLRPTRPRSLGCQECLEHGSSWVHLRLCLTCGHVGCCDSSPSRHATRHFHETEHPVVRSFEPGERWAWCYLDEKVVEAFPTFPEEQPPEHYAPPDTAG